MNQNGFTNQLALSGLGRILTWIGIAWLLGALGLGWLVKSFLVLLGLLILVPIVAIFGLQWWLRRNVVQGACPVCQSELAGLNQTQTQCPSCGELLRVDEGKFKRLAQSGTIDVEAVEVAAQQLED